MIFLSTLLRQSVYDIEGRRLGGLRDICVALKETFPVVTALIVHSSPGNSHHDMIIPWSQVDNLEKVQLNVSHTKLADLHPADIADILEQLDIEDAGAMLDRLDTEMAADAFNEVEPSYQYEILSGLDPERASDLLERLAPDDAADILADIPPAEAERLLNLMPADESRPIRELLRYGAETAGGIMTTEVFSLSEHLTVEETLA